MKKNQVGFLVSYDYELLKNSLPRVYEESDTIILAIDKERKKFIPIEGADHSLRCRYGHSDPEIMKEMVACTVNFASDRVIE